MKCNHDCFHCPYPDCVNDDFDFSFSEELDRQIIAERTIANDSEPIRTGKRGRPKLTPRQVEERKQKRRKKQKKYYEEHKAERIQYQKEYISNNYGKVRAYQNERYQRLKELYGNEYFNALNRKQYHRQRQNESAV